MEDVEEVRFPEKPLLSLQISLINWK